MGQQFRGERAQGLAFWGWRIVPEWEGAGSKRGTNRTRNCTHLPGKSRGVSIRGGETSIGAHSRGQEAAPSSARSWAHRWTSQHSTRLLETAAWWEGEGRTGMAPLLQAVSSHLSSVQPFAERGAHGGDSCPPAPQEQNALFFSYATASGLALTTHLSRHSFFLPTLRAGVEDGFRSRESPHWPPVTVTTLPKLLRSHQPCGPLLPLLPPNSNKANRCRTVGL